MIRGWLHDRKRPALALTLSLSFLLSACGASFAQEFRIVLLAAPPLIESLNLPPALRSGLIQDFTDLAGNTLDFSDCLKAAPTKPAKLICTQTLDTQAEIVIARGHFARANNPKLQRVLGLVRGIIASAKLYYGSGTSANGSQAPEVTADSLKKQIADLKAEMRP